MAAFEEAVKAAVLADAAAGDDLRVVVSAVYAGSVVVDFELVFDAERAPGNGTVAAACIQPDEAAAAGALEAAVVQQLAKVAAPNTTVAGGTDQLVAMLGVDPAAPSLTVRRVAVASGLPPVDGDDGGGGDVGSSTGPALAIGLSVSAAVLLAGTALYAAHWHLREQRRRQQVAESQQIVDKALAGKGRMRSINPMFDHFVRSHESFNEEL